MIDAAKELEDLKNKLILKGYGRGDADHICEQAANEIRDAVIDIVAFGMEDLVAKSSEYDFSRDFLKEVMSVRDGLLFKITTSSGKTDFSEPPFPMLPKILTNAKISNKGDLYKVVPVKNRVKNFSSMHKTTENAIKKINEQREIMKEQKDARGSGDPLSSIDSIKIPATEGKEYGSNDAAVTINFRTASSKQDSSRRWVYPQIKADMTGDFERVNMDIQDQIDSAVVAIIRYYGESV